ncbi:hypothetical protein [Rhodovulum strictum]|uniref:Uncharacterized protein n=1 Tax=Rhodovulum strictum TaxID=58314 RepID=A0A844BHZ1_9RHOB|nr:hypothetical protein [Rhodovulum strictum]MRH20672.1 hypothetical protein [Rhodovulum strictum]
MGRTGAIQLLRRGLAAGLVIAGACALGAVPLVLALAGLLGGLCVYLFWPWQPPRGDIHRMARGAAVAGPDLLGLALAAFFVALPVWLGRAEDGGLHVSAWLVWPMAAGGAALMAIGWRNGCYGLRILPDGFEFHGPRGIRIVPRAAVLAQRPWRRGLPGWMRALAPILPPTAAGAILLARDSTGLTLELDGGARLNVPAEGFEPGLRALQRALRQGVVLLALCGVLAGPGIAQAEGWQPHPLGEAALALPGGWQVTGGTRDHGVDLAGQGGEVLMAFWWFPDEPLAPGDDTLLFEMRSFPAGPALVQMHRIGPLASASVVFEHANAEGERLILLMEGEGHDPAALLARLTEVAERVRFAGQVPAAGSAPGLVANHADPASGLALHQPEGWSRYAADLPGLRLIALMPQGADALVQVALASPQGGRDAAQVLAEYETVLLREAVIPRQIEAERDEPLAGLPGRSTVIAARLYAIGGLSLPYDRGLATLSRAGDADRAVLVLAVHHPEAGAHLLALLDAIRRSVTLDPAAAPPLPDPAAIATAPASPAAALDWAAALALAEGAIGAGACGGVAPGDLPATAALGALGLAVAEAARCGPVAVLGVGLPVDPRGGTGGLLGLAAQRAMAATGGRLALLDPARRAVVMIEPGGGAVSVRVLDLGAAQPAVPQPAPESAPDPAPPATHDFRGLPSEDWLPLQQRGGRFDDWARHEGGALVVDLPAGSNLRTTGLRSAGPVLSLPRPGDPEAVRIALGLDPATSHFVLTLVPPDKPEGDTWSDHLIWLALQETDAGATELALAVEKNVQARIPRPDDADLAALALLVRPDRVVQVTGAEGRILMEGRRPVESLPGPAHVQIAAQTRLGGAGNLTLRHLRLENAAHVPMGMPWLPLGDAPDRVVLFDAARGIGPHLEPSDSARLPLAANMTRQPDSLEIAVPEGQGNSLLGLFSPEVLLWTDGLASGAELRLEIALDPAATDRLRVVLSGERTQAGSDPGRPRHVLDWRRDGEGTSRVGRALDSADPVADAVPAPIPETLALVLREGAIRVEAAGVDPAPLDWPLLAEGQGLRLAVLTGGLAPAEASRMSLRRITLSRDPGDGPVWPDPDPDTRLAPLFPADGAMGWTPFDLNGAPFEDHAQIAPDGTLRVDKPAGHEWPRAGVVSQAPLAVLDDRLERTAYRLELTVDPAMTDGVELLLSREPDANMARNAEMQLRLVRLGAGLHAGDWEMTLSRGVWNTATRLLPAAALAGWDGTIRIDLTPGTVSAALPGIVRLRGTGFPANARGAALYGAVQSAAFRPRFPARLALTGLSAGWVVPPEASPIEREMLKDTDEFDPMRFLGLVEDRASGDTR